MNFFQNLKNDAEKILNIWFDRWMYFRFDLVIDKDDPAKLFLKKIPEQQKWSNQIKRCFPACYIRYIYEQLRIDQNLKLIYKLTPKPLIINGDTFFEFTISRAVNVPANTPAFVNVNINFQGINE
jgi:hypothetical protein